MSIWITNPDYTPYQCSECDAECDPLDFSEHMVDGKSVCAECVLTCYGCGEYLSDEFKELGPMTIAKVWELNGKRKPFHNKCAEVHQLRIVA